MGHWLLLLAFLVSPHAWGEQSTDSTGDYAMDLGQVYGAAQAVKFMKEICNESFPNLVSPMTWPTRNGEPVTFRSCKSLKNTGPP